MLVFSHVGRLLMSAEYQLGFPTSWDMLMSGLSVQCIFLIQLDVAETSNVALWLSDLHVTSAPNGLRAVTLRFVILVDADESIVSNNSTEDVFCIGDVDIIVELASHK